MTWQLSLLFFYIFAAASTIKERTYARQTRLPREVPPPIAFALGVIPVSCLGAMIVGDVWVHWSLTTIALLVAEGSLIGLSFLLGFKALRYIFGSRYEVTNQLSTLISIIGGGVLLGEVLSRLQYLGAALICIGVLVAAGSTLTVTGTRTVYSRRGLVLALLATTCLGLGMIAEKALLNHMSASAYFVYGFGAQTIALLAFSWPHLRSNYRHITRREIRGAAAYGIYLGLGGICFILALQKADNLPLIAAASAFQMPVSVAACMLILRERGNVQRIAIAVGLCLVGLLMLQ